MTQLGVQANVNDPHRSVQDGSPEICCTVNKPKPCTTPGEGLRSYIASHTCRSVQKHAHKRAQPRALMNKGDGQKERNANDG